jgi:hypothetical protein
MAVKNLDLDDAFTWLDGRLREPDEGNGADTNGIPFLITAEMKAALAGFDFTPEQVRGMTPRQAWEALQARGWMPAPKPAETETTKPNGNTAEPATKLGEWDAGILLRGPKPRPRRWLVSKQFCRGYLSSLVAPGGVGKTTKRLTQAIEMAIGRSLLGQPIYQRCRVLVVCLEDDKEELHRRLLAICQHHNVAPAELEGWLFCKDVHNVKLAELKGRGARAQRVPGPLYDMLRDAIAQRHFDVVILDPFVKLHGLQENGNSDMEYVCGLLTAIAREFNVALDSPAHTHKGTITPGDADARRGGSAQRDADRIDFTLTVMSKDEARKFGIEEDDRFDYVRLDTAKGNMTRAVRALWFRLVSVLLGNADETYRDGDDVQAIEVWTPPGVWAKEDGTALSSATLDMILEDIDAGLADGRKYSDSPTAKDDRAAWIVVKRHCPDKPEAQCQEMIKQWVKRKVLAKRGYHNKVRGEKEQGLVLVREAQQWSPD